MKPKTLKEFKKRAAKLSNVYEKLVVYWNGELAHGNNATYPVTIVVNVILHNIAFDGSMTAGYSHENAIKKVQDGIATLKAIDEYENGTYMTHYPYMEISMMFEGLWFSEEGDDPMALHNICPEGPIFVDDDIFNNSNQ